VVFRRELQGRLSVTKEEKRVELLRLSLRREWKYEVKSFLSERNLY
jgi:hypothetical protein